MTPAELAETEWRARVAARAANPPAVDLQALTAIAKWPVRIQLSGGREMRGIRYRRYAWTSELVSVLAVVSPTIPSLEEGEIRAAWLAARDALGGDRVATWEWLVPAPAPDLGGGGGS